MIAVLVGVVYGPVLGFEFTWDDGSLVADNPYLSMPSTLWRSFTHDFWALTNAPHRSGMYRPLVLVSYWLEWRLFGDHSGAWHATNLALHLGNALLLYRLAKAWGAGRRAATAGALLFALHPAQVEAVGNIASRTDLLATAGVLAGCVLLSCEGRRRLWGPVLLLAAMLSKESAVVGPLFALMTVRLTGGSWRRAAAPALIWGLYLPLRVLAVGRPVPAPADGSWEGATRLFRYVGRMFVPTFLPPESTLPSVAPLLAWASVLLLAALAAGLWALRRWDGRVAVGGAWCLLALLPVSELWPVGARYADLLTYLPLAGLGLSAVFLVERRPQGQPVLVALALLAGVASALRLPTWHDNATLWSRVLEVRPDDPLARLNLANALRDRGRREEGCVALFEALHLAEEKGETALQVRSLYNLGNCAVRRDDPHEAIRFFAEAVRRSGGRFQPALYNLAVNEMATGDLEAAAEHARTVTRRWPDQARSWRLLGAALARLGDWEAAIDAFDEAVALDPGDEESRRMRAKVEALRNAQKSGPEP